MEHIKSQITTRREGLLTSTDIAAEPRGPTHGDLEQVLDALVADFGADLVDLDPEIGLLELRAKLEQTLWTLEQIALREQNAELADQITAIAPRFGYELESLQASLEDLMGEVAQTALLLGTEGPKLIPVVRPKIRRLAGEIRKREHKVRRILQEAYTVDVGVGD